MPPDLGVGQPNVRRDSSSSVQVQYSSWTEEDSNPGASQAGSSVQLRGDGSGVHASSSADEEEDLFIFDNAPPPKSSQS